MRRCGEQGLFAGHEHPQLRASTGRGSFPWPLPERPRRHQALAETQGTAAPPRDSGLVAPGGAGASRRHALGRPLEFAFWEAYPPPPAQPHETPNGPRVRIGRADALSILACQPPSATRFFWYALGAPGAWVPLSLRSVAEPREGEQPPVPHLPRPHSYPAHCGGGRAWHPGGCTRAHSSCARGHGM